MSDERFRPNYTVAVIGCGGIGSWVMHSLIRPLSRFADAHSAFVEVRMYDSDLVEDGNLHHQCFRPDDLGKPKVIAVFEELEALQGSRVRIVPCAWDVRSEEDILPTDLALVAVDSPVARKLVTQSEKVSNWAICTCAADSYLFLDESSSEDSISLVTRSNQEPASCQIPGAIENGNIEAGHLAVAILAQTWILRFLRGLSGDSGAMIPRTRADSVILGTIGHVGREEGVENR